MNRLKLLFGPFCISLITLGCVQNRSSTPQLGKDPVSEVIKAMTLVEKVDLVTGMGAVYENIPANVVPPNDPVDEKVPERVPGAAGRTHAIPRLNIPSVTLSDGPAGVRINPIRKGSSNRYYATAFPVATLLASSWDTALVCALGSAFGTEVRDYGIDVLLAPGMNIHRNPLGGRNFEYYSEDPVVTGHIAAAFVRGTQANGVGTSIKHFAVNNQEFNRMKLNTHVSERTMRELYLRNFEITLQHAQPWTIMSSYNLVNGIYTSESEDLLTRVLRDEWGYKGLVMTDWWGGHSAKAQIAAGNDLLMPGTAAQKKELIEAVKGGQLSMSALDKCVERVLLLVLKTPSFAGYKYSDNPDIAKNAQVARSIATEGMVLLKNTDNSLPMVGAKKVALFGNTSYNLIAGGTGSGDVNKPYVISLEQGFTNAGYQVNESLAKLYRKYITEQKAKQPSAELAFFAPPPIPEITLNTTLMNTLANEADVAVVTIGRNAGEGGDRKVAGDFTLTTAEQAMLTAVATSFHKKGKKMIVVLNIGGVIETFSWRDKADGILLAWQPGMEGGNAIVDVLSGKVNPSGKLTSTFPVAYQDVPSANCFPGRELPSNGGKANPLFGKPAEVTYEEGIYVGYRYYNTFGIKTAYEFGYGLSYTDFTYSDLHLSTASFRDKLEVTVKITNTGTVAGKEVVQLYIGAPKGTIAKPVEELKGFAKTSLLKPGASQTLTFILDASMLASFDTAGSCWKAEAGMYDVKIGTSSLNIKLRGTFNVENEIITKKVKHILPVQQNINELQPAKSNS